MLPICIDLSREQKKRGARRTLTGRNYRTPFVQASRNVAKVDSKLVSTLFLTRRRFVIGVERTEKPRIPKPHNSFRKTISEDDRKRIRKMIPVDSTNHVNSLSRIMLQDFLRFFPFCFFRKKNTSNSSLLLGEKRAFNICIISFFRNTII